MGNQPNPTLTPHSNNQELQNAIRTMFDIGQGKSIAYQNIQKALQFIYLESKRTLPYELSPENFSYDMNPLLIQVMFHPKYPQLLRQLIDLFIAEEKFVLNKINYFVQKQDWLFLALLASFLVTHLNPKIRQFCNSIFEREDVFKTKIAFAQQISGKKQCTIPNVFESYENKEKYFKSLFNNITTLINIRNGILGKHARKVSYLGELICNSYVFYLQLYFQFKSLEEVVKDNYVKHFRLSVFMLGYAIQIKNDLIVDSSVMMIQSLLSYAQIPEIPPTGELKGFQTLPVNKAPSSFHQIILMLVYNMTTQAKMNKLQALNLIEKICSHIKEKGDYKILYYLEILCDKVKFWDLQRILLEEFVEKFIKLNGTTTKKIEEYRKAWESNYKVKTSQGQKIIQKKQISRVLHESLEGDRFQDVNQKYIFSQSVMYSIPEPYNSAEIWKQILSEDEDK